MTLLLNYLSPRSKSGSFLFSIATHGALALVIVLVLGRKADVVEAPKEETVELNYDVFDEPPPPTPVEHHVARVQATESVKVAKQEPVETPKEMQDEKGEVAGTQKATPETAAPQASDGDGTAATTPYYRIKPKYPRAALVSGIEGWILMQIDINEKGEVENIRVIDGVERNMFQAEARRAVEQWKYKPYVDQKGNPVRKDNRQVRIDFKLNETATL